MDPNYKGMKTASPQSERKSMQPFEHIGPPETSMDGPVTYARAQRGEIPMREGNPNQKLQTAEHHQSPLDEEEGLKLKLELNLDVEVELKASIHGDLTLALL
jgi:small subunit ribosomal protein S8e